MALNDTKLRNILGKPYSGPAEITDANGLSVRISPKGVLNFQYRFLWSGKYQRVGIGRYPSVSLKDARNIADELKVLLFSGTDPRIYFIKTCSSRATLKDCLAYWYENYVITQLRPKTQNLYQSTVIKIMDGHFANVPIEDITAKQWVDFFTKQEKVNPRRARQVLSQLRTAIHWCVRRQLISSSSLLNLLPRDFGSSSKVGDRVLTYNELAEIWLKIERSRASSANKLLHQMLMLWGARNSELRLATKSHFDLESMIWTIPKELSKMGNIIRRPIFEQIEPFVERAMTTYQDVLFPGDSLTTPITISSANRYIGRIRSDMDIGYWRAHDFRRTLATRLSEQGVMPHVTERMLGHDLGGIMAVYNKHDWIEEQKKGYELHADKIFWHVKKLSSA
ncbi:Integrase [Rosenbergiella nectarea]|uniref:Integrase n=1 Tax=Rosenbergiella nectarea TaxID=988801 RepID=A0A1H9MQ98_9GAMM|nr:site-specific integrase [Rosenbergiella nectarea]SER25751.1 Integrase [Rosenbergiella nectarea]